MQSVTVPVPSDATPIDPPAKRPSRMIEAVAWMVTSTLIFALGNALIRILASDVHPFEVVFFRNLFGLLIMLPWAVATGGRTLQTGRATLYATRSLTSLTAMLSWFYGISLMPLPDATALGFTMPLFATVGAALFLGEMVQPRRWAAVATGFAGVLIVIRPDADSFGGPAFLILLQCVASAATTLQVRTLAKTDSPLTVVTYMGLFLTPMALVPALFVWTWPSWTTLGGLAVLGIMLTLGQLAVTRAFRLAEASALMPYDYVKLPFTAMIAWPLFGEAMDLWGWVGAGVIAGSALFTAHRDAGQSRRDRAAKAELAAGSSPAKP